MDRPPRAQAETQPTCVRFPMLQGGSLETSVSGNPDSGRSRSASLEKGNDECLPNSNLEGLLLASLNSTADPTHPYAAAEGAALGSNDARAGVEGPEPPAAPT